MRYGVSIFGLIAVSALVLSTLFPADTKQDRLARHINLGKAFYENPATPQEAVEEFRQALALNPGSAREHLNYGLALLRAGMTKEGVAQLEKARSIDATIPHPYFNLGVVFKKEGDFARATKEFQQMAKLVPDEPITHYNLGTLYKLEGQIEKALAEFETAARLDPSLAAPHFQLFNTYRVGKRTADAQRELAIFQEIKKQQTASGTSEDMDWSYYAEILETIAPPPAETGAAAEVVFQDQRLGTVRGSGAGIILLDVNNDGRVDALAWSSERAVYFRNTVKGFLPAPIENALGPLSAGDFNNDGFPDLCAGARLILNQKGRFTTQEKPLHAGEFRHCIWVDYDHDYDLDLLLLGDGQVLLRNNGDGSWTDVSSNFPFVAGKPSGAVVLELREDNGFDLVIAYQDRTAVVYRDRKMGRYEASPLPFALSGSLEAGDFNQDGFLDLAAINSNNITFVQNHRGSLRAASESPLTIGSPMVVFADFQNRGRTDFVAGADLLLHRGGFRYQAGKLRGAPEFRAAVAAELTGDGLIDIVGLRPTAPCICSEM